jgi:hypothetical protein
VTSRRAWDQVGGGLAPQHRVATWRGSADDVGGRAARRLNANTPYPFLYIGVVGGGAVGAIQSGKMTRPHRRVS